MTVIDSLAACKLLYNNPILGESESILFRSRLQAAARRLGFSDLRRQNMVLVASEMASNQLKYAGGHGVLQIWQQPGPALDIVALDFGPGIADLAEALKDGYSSSHTLGKGLGSIFRLSDASGMYTKVAGRTDDGGWHGTVVWSRFDLRNGEGGHSRRAEPAEPFSVGLFCRALSDDRYIGDRVYLHYDPGHLRWLHLDGLGHGEGAQSATENLASALARSGCPREILKDVDKRLESTRGAVAIAGHIDITQRAGQVAGVGDMAAHYSAGDYLQNVTFAPGILGKEHKTPQPHSFSYEKKFTVLTASDGIRRSWKAESFPGLFSQHPQVIAYALGNLMGRVADDQSVCVLRVG